MNAFSSSVSTVDLASFGPIGNRGMLAPLGHGLLVRRENDPPDRFVTLLTSVARRKRSQNLFTILYCSPLGDCMQSPAGQWMNLLPPFLRRRLETVRCAFSCVASIMTVSVFCPSAAIVVSMLANTPNRPQPTHLLQRVFGGPYSAGASCQRNPLRSIKIIPLNTLLPSTC